MATRNRQRFLRHALQFFAGQTYPNKELIVVDDGDRSAESLCRGIPHVRHVRLKERNSLGTKLNMGIEAARGEVLQKLDDDDYYGPEFLATSVSHLPARTRRLAIVTGCCFLVLLRGEPGLRHSGHGWTPGGTLCFHRELWERIPFRDVWRSEDSLFLRDHHPRLVRVCRAEEYILVRHGANTWNKMTTGDADNYFRACPRHGCPLEEIVPPGARRFYRSLTRAQSPRQRAWC